MPGLRDSYSIVNAWKNFYIVEDAVDAFGKVPYTMSISSAGYATLYLGYDVVIPSGVKAFVATGITDNSLNLAEIYGVIPAETGVIIKASPGNYTFEISDESNYSTSILKGVLYNTPIESGSALVLSSQNNQIGFYRYSGDILQANKAYLPYSIANEAKIRIGEVSLDNIDKDKTTDYVYRISGNRDCKDTEGLMISNGKVIFKK